MKIEIRAQKRTTQGTGASRRLRRAGRAPGILYGGEQPPVNVELEQNDLLKKLHTEAFHSSILTLDLEGSKEPVLLRSFHMHPFKAQVQHVDFQRVSKDKKIHMKVPLHFVRAEVSPGVKEQGGVASHVLTELDISCLPDDLPEYIEVDLSGLSVGHSIHARDLALPSGVDAVLHRTENPVVATVIMPALITEEEEAAAAAALPTAGEVPTAVPAQPEKAAEAEPAAAEKGAEKREKK